MAGNEPTLSSRANQYIREVLHNTEAPPAIPVRYFYTSPLAIDDPLSPLPPPPTGTSTAKRVPPRPFSQYDNDAIQESWLDLRKKILKHNEEFGEKDAISSTSRPAKSTSPPGPTAHSRSTRTTRSHRSRSRRTARTTLSGTSPQASPCAPLRPSMYPVAPTPMVTPSRRSCSGRHSSGLPTTSMSHV